jgi:hypothetical protein
VYEVSFVVCEPPTPGSAVCRERCRFVTGELAALSAIFAHAVALKISLNMLLQVPVAFGIKTFFVKTF